MLELLSVAVAAATSVIPRRIHVCVNPFGGGGVGLETLEQVRPVFDAAGVEVVVLETEYAGHAGEYVQTLPLLDAFVGIGGDGTAHEIANAMLQRPTAERVPFGMIPAGSGNTWAYDLGLEDAISAAETISRGSTCCVDAMSIGSAGQDAAAIAINICGFGMPAAVLEQANALRWLGSAQYELAGLVLIATGQTHFEATLEAETADGSIITRRLDDCSFVQAQINMHMGKRVAFAPAASMDDGLLDLVVVSSSRGLDILHANARARGATHDELPFVEMLRCKSYTLKPLSMAESGSTVALNLDGELASLAGPVRVACMPGALDVCAETPLRRAPRDTSAELEPQLVMSLVRLLEGGD